LSEPCGFDYLAMLQIFSLTQSKIVADFLPNPKQDHPVQTPADWMKFNLQSIDGYSFVEVFVKCLGYPVLALG